jgi:hypothetical protein
VRAVSAATGAIPQPLRLPFCKSMKSLQAFCAIRTAGMRYHFMSLISRTNRYILPRVSQSGIDTRFAIAASGGTQDGCLNNVLVYLLTTRHLELSLA